MFKKSHGATYWAAGVFSLAIEASFGINAAFVISQSMNIVVHSLLDGSPVAFLSWLIVLIISLAFGACIVIGGMWIFSGFLDSLDDAEAYIVEYGTGRWPAKQRWALLYAILLIDLTTLLFRATFFAEKGFGAVVLFLFSFIFIFLPPILGAIVHVAENTPRERRFAKVRTQAVVRETDDAVKLLEAMPEDLRTLWIDGNREEARAEHYRRILAEREENRLYEQQQMEARTRGKQRKGIGDGVTVPLAAASLAQQADERS